jgi:hypothetical protein
VANAKHIIENKFEDQFLDPDIIAAIKAEVASAAERLTELLGTKVSVLINHVGLRVRISLTTEIESYCVLLASLNIGHDQYAKGVTASCFYVVFQTDEKWDIKHFDDPAEVAAAVGFMELAAAKGYYISQSNRQSARLISPQGDISHL